MCGAGQASLAATQASLEEEQSAHRASQQTLDSVRRDMAAAEAAAEEVTERLNADVAKLEVPLSPRQPILSLHYAPSTYVPKDCSCIKALLGD